MQGLDGRVQQRFPHLFGHVGLAGCLDPREADEEEHLGAVRVAFDQRAQDLERLQEAPRLHQRPRPVDSGGAGLPGRGGGFRGRGRLPLRRSAQHQGSGDREDAGEQETLHSVKVTTRSC